VIPASATGKISFRLVPDQDPEEIYQSVQDYLVGIAPPTVRLSFSLLGKAWPATVDLNDPVVVASDEAYRRTWGVSPVFIRGGGSLPVATMFQQHIHPAILLTGFGLPDDREHSPNESFDLVQLYNGIEMMVNYFEVYRSLVK
jgi:acetylornithine deacetylase/succinyl-diaminopimelate desuccinylase-like protein